MLGIGLGVASFAIIFWVDLISLKGIRFVKPLLWVAASGLFVVAILQTAHASWRVPLPVPLQVFGHVFIGLACLLLIYSLFIEIPLFSTHIASGSPQKLVVWGTYALCRHPAVLWLGGLIAGAFLASGSLLMLPAFLVWIGLDVLYVFLQERLFFPKLFGREYQNYQRRVPMVIPTPDSVARCIRSIRIGPPGK